MWAFDFLILFLDYVFFVFVFLISVAYYFDYYNLEIYLALFFLKSALAIWGFLFSIQSWVFIGRTDAELQYFGHLMQRAD